MHIPMFDLFFFAYVSAWELFWLFWLIRGIREAKKDEARFQAIENELRVLKKDVRDMLVEVSERLEIAIERSDEPEKHDTLRAVGSQK